MGSTSLQASMDSSDWLLGPSSSLSGATEPMGSRPSVMEKRPRPHQDPDPDQTQVVRCPRCDSTRTKFCYYNNYSLSQPRHFCKSCRRYWTKGGTLRNIPVGGVSRKNKRLSSTTTNHRCRQQQQPPQQNCELPLKFSACPNFMFENFAVDSMENEGGDKFPAVLAAGGYWSDMVGTRWLNPGMMVYDQGHYGNIMSGVDEKTRGLAFEWQEQTGCYASGEGRNGSSGYLLGVGSWAG